MKSIFRSDSDREPPLACQLRVVEADFSIPTSGNASGTICRDSRGRLAYHFLRRPISINYVDRQRNEVWFLIQLVGDGTKRLGEAKAGDIINVVLPLGNCFTMPEKPSDKLLLVGGGVGTAPMLYLGEQLAKKGCKPTFLLGARSDKDLLQLEQFAAYGEVYTTTEDGSHGEKGYVTQHSILNKVCFEQIYTCGPKPMMMAVAKYAKSKGISCEVSLENMMACGIGACLCCVENTTEGHLCVCKEGPVLI